MCARDTSCVFVSCVSCNIGASSTGVCRLCVFVHARQSLPKVGSDSRGVCVRVHTAFSLRVLRDTACMHLSQGYCACVCVCVSATLYHMLHAHPRHVVVHTCVWCICVTHPSSHIFGHTAIHRVCVCVCPTMCTCLVQISVCVSVQVKLPSHAFLLAHVGVCV